MADFCKVSLKLPGKWAQMEFDRKIIMKGLKQASRLTQQLSKRLISPKRRSKPGEYPGRNTGRMRRNVKVVNAKRRDRLWSRVEVASFKEDVMFYPAVLNYGRKDHKLEPRKNFIADAQAQLKKTTDAIIEDACWDALKVWK